LIGFGAEHPSCSAWRAESVSLASIAAHELISLQSADMHSKTELAYSLLFAASVWQCFQIVHKAPNITLCMFTAMHQSKLTEMHGQRVWHCSARPVAMKLNSAATQMN